MSKLRAAVERAQQQFLFYGKEHRAKLTKGPPLTPELQEATIKKAIVNEDLANEMQAALDSEPFDVLALEKVQDYRFGSLVKGQRYAFARGLTINPSHLPAALDAMKQDGFTLVCMFGEAQSDKMGLIFSIDGPDPRVQGLLEANSELVLKNRQLKEMLLSPPRHDYWGAGEADCPKDIKAPNGELHTMRCKACGQDNPRNQTCLVSLGE